MTPEAPNEQAVESASALKSAREAIARWTKGAVTPHPVRAAGRVSPQSRWFAQTQLGLAAWISEGGFSQADAAGASARQVAELLYME
jgi:hypothetical protein